MAAAPSSTIALSVNLNKIALLRNSRSGDFPKLSDFAELALDSGAQGLTVHPRPDQRHIRADDVAPLAALCRARPGVEFNIEGNPFAAARGRYPGFIALVAEARPDQCTLVPDSDSQLTSDHGFDLHQSANTLAPIIAELKGLGVRVSLFMDPDPEQMPLAKALGADRVELYTGPYAWAFEQSASAGEAAFQQHCQAAQAALAAGLGINAGHDLNLQNLPRYKHLPGLQEVSIGHALTVDALRMGFAQSIQAYLAVCG